MLNEANPQLTIYGAAGVREYGIAADFKRVRTVIVQPRLDHISERTQSIQEIESFEVEVAAAVAAAELPDAPLVPSAGACQWCRVKATCPALRDSVATQVFDSAPPSTPTDFDDYTVVLPQAHNSDEWLAAAMNKAELIEGWVKAVRAEVERRLLAGTPVPGFKLVQGKRGNRKWSDATEAETTLKAMRVPHDRMYDYSLVTPTTVEKLFKEGIVGPRQWPRLQPLITQSAGSPSVAPESDKRPAIEVTSASASFDDVTDLS